VTQRQPETIGTGASAAVLNYPRRYARLDAYPAITDGGTATIDVPLVAPTTATMATDMRVSSFEALFTQMGPGGRTDPASSFGWGVFSAPHTVLGPDLPVGGYGRSGFLSIAPGTPDTNYGDVTYAVFLDPSWKSWRQIYYQALGTVAVPGGTTVDLTAGYYAIEAMSPTPPNPIVPVLGPVTSPLVGGQDASGTVAAPVGLQPVISWSPPQIGSATHYWVAITEVASASGTPTGYWAVFVRNGLSFKVPPGLLKAGSTYAATISAIDAPWDVLDGNPWGNGAPYHSVDRITGTFTP
jgi:hypothetical protein